MTPRNQTPHRTLCVLALAASFIAAPCIAQESQESGEVPPAALGAAISTAAVGGAALVSGGIVHLLAEDKSDRNMAYILYASGGFLVMTGLFILGTSSQTRSEPLPPAKATAGLWGSKDSRGLYFSWPW